MFGIGEFARLGGVSVRTLHHYDEIGLLPPATVDPETGYRGYTASQLGALNRIIALKELGLSLTQVSRLLAGITVGELRGMLALRRAQLEQELDARMNQMLGIEARLRYMEKEGAMPADDITVKKIPAFDVVAVSGQAPGWGPANIVPVVNRLDGQLAGISGLVSKAGPRLIFYKQDEGDDVVTVNLALPVKEAPAELPPPARYLTLPEIEAVTAVRNGAAATIFPMVYHDLAQWAEAHGYRTAAPGREIWINEVDDIADVEQQVFEIQLPFDR